MLVQTLINLLERASATFPQHRTRQRAVELALGLLTCFGQRTLSRAICAVGRQQQDWTADYRLFSQSPWEAQDLFDPVFEEYVARYPSGPVVAPLDATHLPRAGRKVPGAFWQRDPMSPPFHTNLVLGLRFVQATLVFPHHTEGDYGARSVPAAFFSAPTVKKPGKKASEEERVAYRANTKTNNLSHQGLGVMREMRQRLDGAGAEKRLLVMTVDGSFCNRTVFRAQLERTVVVARCRKDASLCFPAPADSRRVYAEEKFTPESVRQDDDIPYQTCRVFYGGQWREIRYKVVPGVLWQRGAGKQRLRLIVLAPMPYQNSPNGRRMYHQPAFLLVTEADLETTFLIQAYLDRWQIEVNHRDEKDILGVGDAQVWSVKAVPRQPAFSVAAYSMLLLATMKTYGVGRTADYLSLPKWRKPGKRASSLDMITKLRDEINERGGTLELFKKIKENASRYAYA